MNWREAFLKQARDDAGVMDELSRAGVAYAHQLHYLQMFSEKLGRGLLLPGGSMDRPEPTHAALVTMLRWVKGQPQIGRRLGYTDKGTFRAFVDSVLPLALEIQALAPAIAGFTRPNPEYPWWPVGGSEPVAPCDYRFPEFDPKGLQMAKLVRLLRDLAFIAG
jgi:hypothetical protein